MKRILLLACWVAILAAPVGVLGTSAADASSGSSAIDKDKDKDQDKDKKDKDVKDKSVPAPPTLVLLGAAGIVAGASRLWLNRRRI